MALTFVKASGIDVTGNYTVNSIDASANVSAGNVKTNNLLYANGTAWSLGGTYSNTNVAAYLPTYTGNVSANYFIGNGSTLTSLTGSNVIGYVPNANIANSATIAGTVTTAAQPNITSVGTLSSLTVSGLITATGTGIKTANIQDSTGTITITTKYDNVAGDAGIYGNLTVGTSGTGNVTATYFIGNGSQLTGLPASYSNTNVAAYLPTYTGNVSANYFIGNGATLTSVTGSNVTGYVPNANLANTATSATTAGTVTTNAQPNITSVGTLTGLSLNGTITGNLLPSANVTYDLGNNTNRFKDLYLSGTTIYLGQQNLQANATTISLSTGLYVTGNIDSTSINANNLSVSGAAVSYSVYLNESSYITVPSTSADSLFGSENYTIEFWCKTSDTSWEIFAPEGGVGPALIINLGSFIFQYQYGQAGIISTSATSILNNAWHHVAVVRNSGTVTVYFDGVSQASASNSTNYSGQTQTYDIGYGNQSAGRYLNGYLSNFRIVNGTAVYTTTFTPSTSPLTAIANTKLLTFQNSTLIDNSTSARTLGSSGTYTLQSTPIPFAGYGPGGAITATGNISASNANLGNAVIANYFIGDGSLLTGISAVSAGRISNGNSNVNIATANGNITIASAGNTVITVTGTGVNIAGYANLGSGNLTTTGNATAGYFIGSGNNLSNIQGSNVTGAVSYATTANAVAGANVSGQVGNALIAGTVYTNAQPNITSVGSLTGLVVSGDATVTGNLTVSGNTVYTNVTNLYVKDPIIEMGGGANGAPLSSNDGKDRGTLLHYYTTETVDAFMGWDNSNSEFGFGSNVTISNEVVTFNSFGNIRAGYFIGNGSTLTSVAGANVTGYVPLSTTANTASTVTTNAQPNITSVGTLTGLNIAGNIIPTSNVTYDLGNSDYRFRDLYLSGNTIQLGGGNISISGNSMVLTNPIGGQFIVDGAYSEYSGVANTVSTNAQPNITSVGTLTGLTSTGIINFSNTSNVTIGNVGNFHIPGGSADYVLTTDGTGNLSWEAQSGGNVSTTIAVDNFTGNGVQDTFTLSVPPSSINSVFVNYNGVFVGRSSYSLSGANLTFGSSPANGSNIEVTTINGLPIGSGSFTTRVATGDNSTANYTVTSGSTVSSVLVTLDGVLQTPTTDYTVSSSTLTFTTAPANNVAIQIRELAVAVATSSAGASWTYSAISANTTAVAGYRYIVDTSSSNLTITLPAAGTLGDEVMIIDGTGNSSTHAITVDRNGGKIQGLTSNMTVTTDRAAFTLVYYNSTQGWILTNV